MEQVRKALNPSRSKRESRWMVKIYCEACRGGLERSIQDIRDQKIGKGQGKCPHCGASITYEKGLLPKDMG